MKVTLSDIAKRVGVTPSTVQRALNNIDGVGKVKREEIKKIAKEMGYERNYIAASLKKGLITFAIVLPEQAGDNRYYSHYLWEGVTKGLNETVQFNIKNYNFEYERKSDNIGFVLEEAINIHGKELDGIITMGTDIKKQIEVLEKAKSLKIPVVFVGTDSKREDLRISCVKTNDETAGRMAADLLINFRNSKARSQVIISGDFTISDQYKNAQGFEKQVLESKLPLEIIKLANDSNLETVKDSMKQILNSGLNISAIYSCSARNTVAMCEAIIESENNENIKLIGNDVFPESIEFIQSGVLAAIIHKRASVQAQVATEVLIDAAIKKPNIPSKQVLINSIIVMKSNLNRYI